MKKIVLFLLTTLFCGALFAQPGNWQARGTRDKYEGLAAKKVLLIPTGCGAPSVLLSKDSLEKQVALFADTCNNRLYFFNSKTLVWDTVHVGVVTGGGSTDTLALSNRINLKVNIADTGTMLANYRHWLAGYLKAADIAGKVNYTDTAALLTNYKHWLEGYLKAADIANKQNTSDTTSFDATKTDVARGIKDSLLNQGLSKVLARENAANYDIRLHRERGRIDILGNSTFSTVAIEDTITGANAGVSVTATEAVTTVHAASATELGLIANNTRGRIYAGTPNDELIMRIDSDTNRVSIQQINGAIRGSGSLKVNFPITQSIWSNNYVQDLQAKSGTIALTSNINDSLNKNKLYIQSGYGVGDSLAYFPNDSTLRFKDFVLGYGLSPHARTDTSTGLRVDTSLIATIARAEKIVDDSAAVLRALIGTAGGASDSLWTQRRNANYNDLVNLQKIHIQTRTGGGGGTVYNTWNPADKAAPMTLSGGNLAATGSGGGQEMVRGTIGKSAGKWYWEVTLTSGTAFRAGIAQAGESLTDYLGFGANGYSYEDGGNKVNNGTATAYGPAVSTGNTVGYALDLDAGTLKVISPAGVDLGVAYSGLTGTFYPALSNGFSASTQTANFGATAFIHSVPSGYNAGWFTTSGGFTYANTLRTNDAAQVFVGDSSAATTAKFNVNGVSYFTDSIVLPNNEKIIFGSNGDYIGYDFPTQSLKIGSVNDTKVKIEGFANTFIEVSDNDILLNGSPIITGKAQFQDSAIFNQSHRLKFKNTLPSASSTDSVLVVTSNGELKTRAQSAIGGGSSLTELSNATDANFTATVNSMIKIPNGTLTANRTITMPSGTSGQRIIIWNRETTYTINLTGVNAVYWDETTMTSIPSNTRVQFIYQDSKWIIEN